MVVQSLQCTRSGNGYWVTWVPCITITGSWAGSSFRESNDLDATDARWGQFHLSASQIGVFAAASVISVICTPSAKVLDS